MEDFAILLDAPESASGELQVAELGEFKHPGYGDFSITANEVEDWGKNLGVLPGGEALIDLDHLSDKPGPQRRTEAAGWITRVELNDGIPKATVHWTPVGEAALKERRYRFFSPAYGTYTDSKGVKHENVLTGGALTNKPFLDGMPQITLAAPAKVQEALRELDYVPAAAVLHLLERLGGGEPSGESDSRRSMKLTADNLKSLGITDEAAQKKILDLAGVDEPDALKVLEAIEEAKPKADLKTDPPETKTLEQLAKEDGKILLDAADHKKLVAGSAAGLEAMRQLDQQTFDIAFTKALEKGSAVAGEKDEYQALYEINKELALKRLENAQPIVNVKPQGRNVTADGLDAPEGVHPESYALDIEVKKHLLENPDLKGDYMKALEQVQVKQEGRTL